MNGSAMDITIQELKNGYIYNEREQKYICLHCKTVYERGNIYKDGENLVDAKKAMRLHIVKKHGSPLEALLFRDKKETGITEVQREFLIRFYKGVSDGEIAKETGTSPSTVRYQRYNFREKAKQAKMFLAISELLEERSRVNDKEETMKIHKGAKMVDERYMVTDSEAEKIIKTCFKSVEPLVLRVFSSKEKKKLVILSLISKQFKEGEKYSEKQVNEILKAVYFDFVTLRRYLIEYGFLDRTPDGSEYWVKNK